MQVVLIMFRNGGERRSFSVARNLTTIGRREDCDLRIPVGDVSRKHCRLVLSTDNLRVQDLGSSNGTYVNGTKVQDAFLNAGDTVSVGPVNFVVQIDGVPDEADLAAPAASPAGDTGAGATGLALEALESRAATGAEPDAGEFGDLAEVGDLLEPLPEAALSGGESDDVFAEGAALQPPADAAALDEPTLEPAPEMAVGTDLTLDELPSGLPADAAFGLVEPGDWRGFDSSRTPEAPPQRGRQSMPNLGSSARGTPKPGTSSMDEPRGSARVLRMCDGETT